MVSNGEVIMDYRTLLKKYIKHVGEIEGVTYSGEHDYCSKFFTEEEWAELRKLDTEVYQELLKEWEAECQ